MKRPVPAALGQTGARHRGTHSLQFRFFSCVALTAAIYIAVITLLNLLFFDQYYMLEKRKSLAEIYQRINSVYSGEVTMLEDELKQLEKNNNIRISILNEYQQTIYDTIYQHDGTGSRSFVMEDPLGQTVYVYDSAELAQRGYTFSSLQDPDGQVTYIALLGTLNNGDTVLLRIPTTALQEERSVNFAFLIFSGLVALLACLIAGYFISNKFTRPITEMTELARAITNLDFSKKYTGTYDDELGELGASLNKMSHDLESSIHELQQMNEQLQREIEEKRRIDDMRKEFIINISHDLKTPIALIQGYAEGLRIGISDSEESKNEYCDIIIDEAKRMNYLVHQLLDLSKLELGNTVPSYSDFDAYELAEMVVEKTQVMWQEKQLHVDLTGVGNQTLHADYDMLERAVMNYMTNAIDHTPQGGRIRLFSEEDTRHIVLTVENEGSTLAAEEMDKIWDKFYKLDKSRTRVSGGGSGIGLSIVQAIMRAHNGGCGVRNTETGVAFYLSLPKDYTE